MRAIHRSDHNHLFIGGWENFDLDVFCRRNKKEVKPRKKKIEDEKVS